MPREMQAMPSQRAGEIGSPSTRLAAMTTPTNCVERHLGRQEGVDDPAAPEECQPRHRLPAENTEEDPLGLGNAGAEFQHQIGRNRERNHRGEPHEGCRLQHDLASAARQGFGNQMPAAREERRHSRAQPC